MPRVRDLKEYSTTDASHDVTRETLIEVPARDTVQTLTIRLEPAHFVQIKRVQSESGWSIVTNIDAVVSRDSASIMRADSKNTGKGK